MSSIEKGEKMITKTKINISVDKQVHKDIVKVCKAMGMKVSTFTDRLYRGFLASEKRPKETIDQLVKRIEKEYQGSLKRDIIVIF